VPDAAQSTDSDLVAAALAGGPAGAAAVAVLVVRHRPGLLAVCRDALGDPELAEDVAQEALVAALGGLDRLRQPDRFGPWLAGIGRNLCRRRLRERGRERVGGPLVLGGGPGGPGQRLGRGRARPGRAGRGR
jgi:DNA-directed RNA polymerase specialized sigma24 family protein